MIDTSAVPVERAQLEQVAAQAGFVTVESAAAGDGLVVATR